MPALPSVPKVIKTAIKQTLSEDIDVLNILYWLYSGTGPTSAELATWAGSVAASWVSRLFSNMSHQVTGGAVTATDLTSATAPEVTVPMTGTGAATPIAVPAGSALCLSHGIARRYRGGHPRTYLCGMPNDQLFDAQTWTSALLTAVLTDFTNFEADVEAAVWSGGGTIEHVNVSYYQGFTNHTYPSGRVRPIPTLRSVPVVDLILTNTARTKVASQRRRNLQSV